MIWPLLIVGPWPVERKSVQVSQQIFTFDLPFRFAWKSSVTCLMQIQVVACRSPWPLAFIDQREQILDHNKLYTNESNIRAETTAIHWGYRTPSNLEQCLTQRQLNMATRVLSAMKTSLWKYCTQLRPKYQRLLSSKMPMIATIWVR